MVASPGSVSSAELYSQEDLAHGAGVAVHFPIWALDGVVLPGAGKASVPHIVAVFAAQLLRNPGGKVEVLNTGWIMLQK